MPALWRGPVPLLSWNVQPLLPTPPAGKEQRPQGPAVGGLQSEAQKKQLPVHSSADRRELPDGHPGEDQPEPPALVQEGLQLL